MSKIHFKIWFFTMIIICLVFSYLFHEIYFNIKLRRDTFIPGKSINHAISRRILFPCRLEKAYCSTLLNFQIGIFRNGRKFLKLIPDVLLIKTINRVSFRLMVFPRRL